MKTEESIKIYCYAQHCPSRNGGIVPVREIESQDGESNDWDLIAEGTRDEILAELTTRVAVMEAGRVRDSNDMFALRQLRNALAVVD